LHALWALTRVGDPEAGAGACEALQDGDPRVRAAAAHGAGRIGSADAVPYLRHGMYDPSVAVAREAALALARLGAAGREVLAAESAGPVAPAARYALAAATAPRREELP
jgi:HEAT repeat protein